MPNEYLNPVEDIKKDETIEGKESNDELENLFGNENELTIEAYNEKTGKQYKSWDDVAKSERERDKAFAQKGQQQKKEVKQDFPSSTLEERILKLEKPELASVLDELKADAQATGKSILELAEVPYYQKKAQSISESKDNMGKVSSPSGDIQHEKKETDLEVISKKFSSRMPNGFSAEKQSN